jgi:hypothetical protein
MELIYENINSIDLTDLSKLIKNDEHRGYFLGNAGKEHYKLIAYMSSMFENSNLLDIGTNRGCSSLAMGYNSLNNVHSFDLHELKELSYWSKNITYYIDDVLKPEYKDLIFSSPFILVDTSHDGTFEKQFHTYLKENNYKGYLLLDDIKLNNEMKEYWNWIEEEKYDISDFGHWSGTGLVIFK